MPNWRSEPTWPTPGELIEINQLMVADTGEPYGLIKPGELEAACAHPINQWHYGGERSPAALSAGLMVAVARAHPFVQGNKRTAFAAAQLLLFANGLFLALPDIEVIADELRRYMVGACSEELFSILFDEFVCSADKA